MAKKLFDRTLATPGLTSRFAFGTASTPAGNLTFASLMGLILKDSGAKTANDYEAGTGSLNNITADDTWRSLSLSSKIPVGTLWVLLRVALTSDGGDSYAYFMKDGLAATNLNYSAVRVGAAGYAYGDCWVPVEDQTIQYKAGAANKLTVINVAGYI